MATLAATLAAVKALLDPLVTSGALAVAINGQEDQVNEFPAAWVFFGPATDAFDPGGRTLEQTTVYTGAVRVYVERKGLLLSDYARLVPPIDAVRPALEAAPTLGGVVDRFVCAGHSAAAYDTELNALYADLAWSAQFITPGTYVQDW